MAPTIQPHGFSPAGRATGAMPRCALPAARQVRSALARTRGAVVQSQNPSMVSTLRRYFWMEQENAAGIAGMAKVFRKKQKSRKPFQVAAFFAVTALSDDNRNLVWAGGS